MLRVPTSLDLRGSGSLEISPPFYAWPAQEKLFIKHVLSLKGEANYTLGTHCRESTLCFISSLCEIRMVGGENAREI